MRGKIIKVFKNNTFILLAILVISFFLRLALLPQGAHFLPYEGYYHVDEPVVIDQIIRFPHNQYRADYNTTVQNITAIVIAPFHGIIYQQENYRQIIYIIARSVFLFLGVVSVFLTYVLALHWVSRSTALIAAAFLGFSMQHSQFSVMATLDAAMGFFFVLCFLQAFKTYKQPSLLNHILLAICTGALIGTKVSGLLFFIPQVILVLFKIKEYTKIHLQNKRQVILGYILNNILYFAASLLAFACTTPIVFHFSKYIQFLKTYWSQAAGVLNRPLSWQILSFWYEQTTLIMQSQIFFVLIILGVSLMVFNKRFKNFKHEYIAVLAFIIAYYLFWRWHLWSRYVLSLMPILMVFAAYPLGLLVDSKKKFWHFLGLFFAVGLMVFSLYLNVLGIVYTYNDPRTKAGKYIETEIPPGSSIAFLKTGNYYQFWLYPFVDSKKYKVVSVLDNPDYVLVAGEDKMNIGLMLASGKLLPGYNWDNHFPNPCPWTAGPPNAQCVRFYMEVLPKQYILRRYFEHLFDMFIEFRSGRTVYVYKRKHSL